MKSVTYYYYIYVLLGMMGFLGFPDFYTYITIFLILFVLFFIKDFHILSKGIDLLIVLFIIYQIIVSLLVGGSELLRDWWITIRVQVFSMIFYYVGRYKSDDSIKFLENMKVPMLFAMIIGIVLYFWSPSWYIEKRTIGLSADSSMNAYYESTRLSSFWPWSYTMGYGSLFYFMYFYKDFCKHSNIYNAVLILISLSTLFFAQQRVSIAFLFVFLFLSIYCNPYNNRKISLKIFFFIVAIMVGIIYYLINFADSGLLDYILNRSLEKEDNMVAERYGMFSSYLTVSILGSGVGSFGHAAVSSKGFGAADCEYVRMFIELGLVGSMLLFLIFINALFRAWSLKKYYFFELSVLLFYIAAMIGATPFENYSMQPFLFWFCIGRLYNDDRLLVNQ